MMIEIVIFIGAYLVGSIPTGYLIARWRGIRDIRLHGSGNIGATNVGRVLGFKYFIIVFSLDALKAFLFLKLIMCFIPLGYPLIAAVYGLILGNSVSIFLQFSGGKGIATNFGIVCALFPIVMIILSGIWLVAFGVTRTVGIASVAALIAAPIVAYFCGLALSVVIFLIGVSMWGIYLHRTNIKFHFLRSSSYAKASEDRP